MGMKRGKGEVFNLASPPQAASGPQALNHSAQATAGGKCLPLALLASGEEKSKTAAMRVM